MVSRADSSDPYEIADAPLRDKEQRLIKELEGVRAARASIAVARQMGGGHTAEQIDHEQPVTAYDNKTAGATVLNGLAGTPYYGLGLAEAGMKYLSMRHGHTRTIKNIWKALSDAGVQILSDKPEAALGWAFRKRERKMGDVVLVGNGEWGLTKWYSAEEVERMRASRNNASGRDRDEHSERTKAGMKLASKIRGVRYGSIRKMTLEVIARAEELLSQGKTIREVAKELKVSPSSITGHGLRVGVLRKRGAELRVVK